MCCVGRQSLGEECEERRGFRWQQPAKSRRLGTTPPGLAFFPCCVSLGHWGLLALGTLAELLQPPCSWPLLHLRTEGKGHQFGSIFTEAANQTAQIAKNSVKTTSQGFGCILSATWHVISTGYRLFFLLCGRASTTTSRGINCSEDL